METVAEASPVRVLVADDNADAADVLHDLFETLGCRVEVAYNGKQAVEAAHGFEPQLVVLDVDMPEMDGCEAASKLRREPWSARATFVACTGNSGRGLLDRIKQSGFQHFVTKPVRFDWFEGIVNAIRRRRNAGSRISHSD